MGNLGKFFLDLFDEFISEKISLLNRKVVKEIVMYVCCVL